MLTKVEINNIDVTSDLLNYEMEKVYGDAINLISLNFIKRVSESLTLQTGLSVEVWRGWSSATEEKIFDGYIESFEPEGGKVKINAKDKMWDLIRREVTHVYDSTIDASAGKLSDIFIDLVTTYGGLTADSTSVQDSGDVFLLNKFVCNHSDIFERCKALANALNWQMYYKASTDKVYFEPKGYNANATILNVGSNVIGVPKWTYDNTEMVNDVTVVGAYQEIETTESGRIGVTSGYTADYVQINFEPISVKIYNDNNNPPTTLKVGGLPDSTGTFDYYVDKNQKKIYPSPGNTFSTNSYMEIRFSHAVPIPIHMYNQASINSYGKFTKTITYKDLRSVSDAETRASNYLDQYSTPFLYTTLKVKNLSSNSIDVGQLIRVLDNLSSPAVDENLIINRHRIRYPADYDELDVGDKVWRLAEWNAKIEEKLKRIEEEELANQDLITELVSVDNSPLEHVPRYFQVKYQNMAGDTLLWGNPDWGTFGTYKWGSVVENAGFILGLGKLGLSKLGSQVTSELNHYVRQYNNEYEETFIDDDFKDSSTTATWSGTLDFTNGQIAVSTSIDKNNGTITSATFSADSSGSLVFYMTADGTNYEEVTNAIHVFSNPGNDLRWKAVAGGTSSITSITITNYH